MKLHALGIDYHHNRDFAVERPEGSGDNLLVIFKTLARVKIGDNFVVTDPDTAIIFEKSAPQYYSAVGDEFVNHWIHFDCEENGEFFERVQLPFNTLVSVKDIGSVENLLLQLNLEQVSEGSNKNEFALGICIANFVYHVDYSRFIFSFEL